MEASSSSLRERKKADTRAALSQAALLLALEKGLEAVTTDDIASAANVSPRTFHNYFGSKEEALIAAWRELLAEYLEQLRERPADEPILASLEHVFTAIAAEATERPQETEAHLELLASPALARYRFLLIEEAVQAFSVIVAARTGSDPQREVYPRLVTMAAVSAVVSAYEFPPIGDIDPSERAERIRECFALLRAGLTRPEVASD